VRPGYNLPVNAVVCFTVHPSGVWVRAWMTGRLWNACESNVAREKRSIDKSAVGTLTTSGRC
jgi:hypothetical protein